MAQPSFYNSNLGHRMNSSSKVCLLAAVVVGLLSGCGGDGSATATPTATVSGTAATGAAIAAGTVTLKCVSGTTVAAITGSDGSFSIDIGNVRLPCLGRLEYRDNTGASRKLHTFVGAAGTANITPVTELLVASLLAQTAASAFDTFDALRSQAVTAAQVTAAVAAVKTYLAGLGVATANFPADPVGSPLRAAVGGVGGDDFDRLLDALAVRLQANGKQLGDAVGDVARSATGPTVSGSPGTLTVTNASSSSRNGSYVVSGALFTNADSSGFNGNTHDGLFETESAWGNGDHKVIKAAVWYFDGPNGGAPIVFFACDSGRNKPCSGVTFDPVSSILTFINAVLPETGGTGMVTVNGSVVVR